QTLAELDRPPAPEEIEAALQGSHVFLDCEVLFDVQLRVNPIQLFRRLARRHPFFLHWPGEIRGNTFSYSRPGRPDHYEENVQDAMVLRSNKSAFPDEFPFTIE